MEKYPGNSEIKIPKSKPSNENISPAKIGDGGSDVCYKRRFSPIDGIESNLSIVSSSGKSFSSLTIGSPKNRSAMLQQYNSGSSGSSSCGSQNRLSVLLLSSIKNLEMMPRIPSHVYGTPVKAEKEVLVMDDI